MKTIIIDNYDSFTYNLVHLVESVTNTSIEVVLNDKFEIDYLQEFDHIILSPGPCLPKDSGLLMQVIEQYKTSKKILGVCLGHQAIAESFGASLKNLETVYHGIASQIYTTPNATLFKNIPSPFLVARYHSWVIEKESLSNDFLITATDDKNNIMAIEHKLLSIAGVQFHPESIMTEYGKEMMSNWLSL